MAEAPDNAGFAGAGGGPAGGELPKQYRPSDHEGRIREAWERSGAFHQDPGRVLRGEAEPYCIVIPPPNVTDRLHLGHALNNTLQDILARAHRMMGYETLWMPGTDHAGIATQAVVERRLRKEGRLAGPLKQAMKREEFVAIVQSFKDEYEATITGQLKAMGCSCDWQRQRFTMDEQCARAVQEAFFRLFRDGLIYRGKRLVNWDPVLQTAVADDECEDVEIDGEFYYLRYPLVRRHKGTEARRHKGEEGTPVTWSELRARGWPADEDAEHAADAQAWVTVATTRPETYLGDTAVAVNPRDPRAGSLRGLSVELPLVGRLIPVIEDDYVVMKKGQRDRGTQGQSEEPEDPKAEFATGFLKVTPAHDPNDYGIGQRHNLPLVNVFAPDASISDKHGWTDVGEAGVFIGLSREDARKKVVAEFKARGLLASRRPYRHSVKHSDRSKAAIEPYLSDQWYVRVTDDSMRGAALKAMSQSSKHQSSKAENRTEEGSLTFYPERYAKTFEHWHENIRDWCISRQLWWGHRIPVWRKRVTLTERNWVDELAGKLGVDDIIDGARGAAFAAFRSSDGVQVNPKQDLMPPGRDTVGEYELCLCFIGDENKKWAVAAEKFGYVRDPDVLDTWFSSALWPMSTMGWPDNTDLLRAYDPSDVLCTAREIITLWVSRMVMFNRYLMPKGWPETPAAQLSPQSAVLSPTQDSGHRTQDPSAMGRGGGPAPFRDVFIHAMIQDGEGRKMSKSLGNGVDPLDIIATHGADAMRFTLCQMTTHTQDVRMPVEKDPATGRNTSPKFDLGRNFCNKLWNATRFALGILQSPLREQGEQPSTPVEGSAVPQSPLREQGEQPSTPVEGSVVDRWMLSRLASGVAEIDAALKNYSFSVYAQAVYDLLWRDFCDWYLEAIKPTVAESAAQRAVLAHALETIVRLLHPIAPFITEAIWESLRGIETDPVPGIDLAPARVDRLLATAGWPRVDPSLRDGQAEREFERLRSLVTAVREVRAQHKVPPKRRVTLHAPAELAAACAAAGPLVATLAGLESITTAAAAGAGVAFSFESGRCHLSNLADAVDAGAEHARLTKLAADLEKSERTLEGRLANPGYSEKAPPAMVQQTRDQLAKVKADLAAARAALAGLG